ncbi:MAG: VOC family protein, partial [Pseudomonadota bacterium]
MAASFRSFDIDRQLPLGDEIFLDHIGHFVRDADAASRALARAGFLPTPISIQGSPEVTVGRRLTGTGNITAMLSRGYIEVLFKTTDTMLGREFDAALARYCGIHLAAFSVADARTARERLAAGGFRVHPLVNMQRPVETEAGEDVAAFTIARVEADVMPEGRIQLLTHHTEQTVWQQRWLAHSNSAKGLLDVVIAVPKAAEAAARFARFTGRQIVQTSCGAMLRLDRGGVLLATRDQLTELLPECATSTLPFMAAYAVRVQSLAAAEIAVESADLEWRAFEDGIIARFPAELGEGAWFFVEQPSALAWRREG